LDINAGMIWTDSESILSLQ